MSDAVAHLVAQICLRSDNNLTHVHLLLMQLNLCGSRVKNKSGSGLTPQALCLRLLRKLTADFVQSRDQRRQATLPDLFFLSDCSFLTFLSFGRLFFSEAR